MAEAVRFKNWEAICELGRSDRLLMMALATMDLASTEECHRRIVAAFPECFSGTEVRGPIPLSVMREDGGRHFMREGGTFEQGTHCLSVTDTIVAYRLPSFGFGINDEIISQYPDLLKPLPRTEKFPFPVQMGQVVEWEGRSCVVLEDGKYSSEVWIVPAECVAVDL